MTWLAGPDPDPDFPDDGWPEGNGDNAEPLDPPEDWGTYGRRRPTRKP